MWAIELVKTEDVEINIKRFDINMSVRGISHRINTDQGPSLMDPVGDCSDIIDASRDVGGLTETHQASFVGQQGIEIFDFQIRCIFVDLPFFNDKTKFFKSPPSATVGFMIQIGDDDLIAGFKSRP